MRIILTTILFFICNISIGANKYVDSSYTGTSTGTITQPWKTVSTVQSNMASYNPGDTIYFKRGYHYAGILNFSRSGTATNPIVISAYGTGTDPIFTGTGSYQDYLFRCGTGIHDVIFDHLQVTSPELDVNDHYAMCNINAAFEADKARNITVQYCKASVIGTGFLIIGDSCKFKNCTVSNLRMVNNTPKNINADDDYGGTPVVISGSYNLITDCIFDDCWAYSYDYGFDGGGIEIFDLQDQQITAGCNKNTILNNTFHHCMGFAEYGSRLGTGTSDSTLFAFNEILDNGELYINNTPGGQYDIAASHIMIWNNVIVQQDTFFRPFASTRILNSNTTESFNIFDIRNNIFYLRWGVSVARSGYTTNGQLIHQNNLFNISGGGSLNFTADGSERSSLLSIWINTTGTNTINWDYHLLSTSPARNIGQDIPSIKSGITDAGIYQFATPTTCDGCIITWHHLK